MFYRDLTTAELWLHLDQRPHLEQMSIDERGNNNRDAVTNKSMKAQMQDYMLEEYHNIIVRFNGSTTLMQ